MFTLPTRRNSTVSSRRRCVLDISGFMARLPRPNVACFAAYVESPLSDRKLVTGGDDVTCQLGDIWRQVRELKTETQLLKQLHVQHVTGTKQLLQATFVKIKVCVFSNSTVETEFNAQYTPPTQRNCRVESRRRRRCVLG